MVIGRLEFSRWDECGASWDWTVEGFRRAEFFVSELICSKRLLIEYILGNSVVNDVLTTSCWHSFRVLDRAGEEVPNTFMAPGLFTLAAGSAERVYTCCSATDETGNLLLLGGL